MLVVDDVSDECISDKKYQMYLRQNIISQSDWYIKWYEFYSI